MPAPVAPPPVTAQPPASHERRPGAAVWLSIGVFLVTGHAAGAPPGASAPAGVLWLRWNRGTEHVERVRS